MTIVGRLQYVIWLDLLILLRWSEDNEGTKHKSQFELIFSFFCFQTIKLFCVKLFWNLFLLLAKMLLLES